MNITLPLNHRTQDAQQTVHVPIVLPDYTTVGQAHGEVALAATLLRNGNLAVELTVRREDHTLLYAQRWAYRPDELIPDHRERRRAPTA